MTILVAHVFVADTRDDLNDCDYMIVVLVTFIMS